MAFQIDENMMAPNRAIITRNKIMDDLLSVNPLKNKPGMMHYVSKDKKLWLSIEPYKTMESNLETTKTLYEVITDIRLKEEFEPMASKEYVDERVKEIAEEEGLKTIDLTPYALKTDLNDKVDKINGKGLSTNDFTTEFKVKLEGLYNYTLPSSLPATIITQTSTHRFVSDNEKSIWTSKANGTHSHTKSEIIDFPALHKVATTGSYADLINRPTLSTIAISGSYSDLLNKPNLSTVALSGSYNDLLNKPDVSGYTSKTYVDTELAKKSNIHNHPYLSDLYVPDWDSISNKPSSFTPSTHTHNDKVDKVDGKSLIANSEITRLSTVTNYVHPTNHLPNIITQDANNRFVTDSEKAIWNGKVGPVHNHTKSQITDFPTSLPANGGNADMLDGYHHDSFSKTNHGHDWVNNANWSTSSGNADTLDGYHASSFADRYNPRFVYTGTIKRNEDLYITHNLNSMTLLFTYASTAGNVNPTINYYDNNTIVCYNYGNEYYNFNDCGIKLCIW